MVGFNNETTSTNLIHPYYRLCIRVLKRYIMKLIPYIFISCLISLIFCIYEYGKEESYCGKVIQVTGETIGYSGKRHRPYVERYLVIQFDNMPSKAIKVSPTTYYTAFEGKRICFDMRVSDFKEYPYTLLMLISAIGTVVSFAIMLIVTIEKEL